jgi:hypothetical protein
MSSTIKAFVGRYVIAGDGVGQQSYMHDMSRDTIARGDNTGIIYFYASTHIHVWHWTLMVICREQMESSAAGRRSICHYLFLKCPTHICMWCSYARFLGSMESLEQEIAILVIFSLWPCLEHSER